MIAYAKFKDILINSGILKVIPMAENQKNFEPISQQPQITVDSSQETTKIPVGIEDAEMVGNGN